MCCFHTFFYVKLLTLLRGKKLISDTVCNDFHTWDSGESSLSDPLHLHLHSLLNNIMDSNGFRFKFYMYTLSTINLYSRIPSWVSNQYVSLLRSLIRCIGCYLIFFQYWTHYLYSSPKLTTPPVCSLLENSPSCLW